MRNLKVNVSWHVIAETDGCMVVGFCVDGRLAAIVSGESNDLYEKMKNFFLDKE
ncbi:hypothetical protein LH47_02021 [Anoxybacillus thermarum]|uniref:Uncharacterized protein n=1 Tax=Anoxybacillus thermarum TaxID=404937 RepID=A0A0D0RYY3_9BACL|nr:hypothetical protein [Anoxybacillus thermarum]KIQ93871.1 hypothetical protein LH47_02021 [Anoxybacillus thermarum]